MAIDVPPAWIRHRAILAMHAPWHLLQTVTSAGVRVTSCAEIMTPDDDVEIGADDESDGARCTRCSQHHDLAD